MRDYGKVFSRIWESADFRALTEDGRTLALYLLTCQHGTIAGVFRVPDGYACEDLQWGIERVSQGFANLEANGFATRCGVTKWVWVRKFLEWNPPENPNQRKSAAKIAAGIPRECCWGPDFMGAFGESLGMPARTDWKGSATVAQPLPNQYQEQEQEQNPPLPPAPAPAGSAAAPCDRRVGVDEPQGTEPQQPAPGAAGRICMALKAAGLPGVNPSHPKLLALLQAGVTEEELTGFVPQALSKGAGFPWLLAAVEGERRRAAEMAQQILQGAPVHRKPVAPDSSHNPDVKRTQQYLASQAQITDEDRQAGVQAAKRLRQVRQSLNQPSTVNPENAHEEL